MFLHERGGWNTLYFTFYFGSLMVGPIISGPMAEHIGWRSFWWLNVAMHSTILVLLFFIFPETKWQRSSSKKALQQKLVPARVDISAKVSSTSNKVEDVEQAVVLAAIDTKLDHHHEIGHNPNLHRGRPSKQQFALFQRNAHPLKAILQDLLVPWKLFLFPIVEFSSFVVSWSASSFLTVNLTQSQNFAAPPYLYNSQSIGFMNFATLIGAIIGLMTNSWLSDWVAARLTRRKNGIREPEMRLLALFPYVLIILLGNFMVAFGYQRNWPWEVTVLIGYTCAGIQVAAIPAIATTYSIDSYKPVAGSIMVAITVNKNVWGYGFSKFITPWIEESGYLTPIMTNMCLTFLWCSFGLLFYFKGKAFRRWTKNNKVHEL